MMQNTSFSRATDMQNVTQDIWRFSNQYFYGEKVGNYAVCDGKELVLIETPDYSESIVALVRKFGLPARIFLTHGSTTVDGDKWQSEVGIKLHLNQLDFNHQWLRSHPLASFTGDFQVSSHIRAIHLPNHSPGHTVYFDDREGGSLFSGDGILYNRGHFEIELTQEAREKILSLSFERLLPFHYDPILQGADKLVHQALKIGTP